MCSLSLFFADVLTYKLWTPQRANKTTYKYKQIFTLLLRAFNMTIYFTHFFRISFAHPLKRWAQSNKATSKSTVIQFSNALWLLCLLCESNRFFFLVHALRKMLAQCGEFVLWKAKQKKSHRCSGFPYHYAHASIDRDLKELFLGYLAI